MRMALDIDEAVTVDISMRETTSVAACLNGVRVIELGQVLAGPFAGMIFSDLGAEVIKIERPDGGDDGRRMGPPYKSSDSLIFQDLNRGKKSVTIDFKSAAERETLISLIGSCDIVINNLRPGVAEVGGFDGKTLVKRFPRLIYCNLSAFGSEGPLRDLPGYEPLVQAYSGLASVNGYMENAPVRIGPSVVDLGSGMWIVLSALAALRQRDLTGAGTFVDLSLLETAVTWLGPDVSSLLNENRVNGRRGNAHPLLVPYEAFEAADGMLMLAVGNDRLFQKFAEALGRQEWSTDLRFSTNQERLKNRELLVSMIRPLIAEQPRAQWLAVFRARGIPAAEFNTIAEALGGEQVQALKLARRSPQTERVLLGLPFRFGDKRPGNHQRSPKLGEHNYLLVPGHNQKMDRRDSC